MRAREDVKQQVRKHEADDGRALIAVLCKYIDKLTAYEGGSMLLDVLKEKRIEGLNAERA